MRRAELARALAGRSLRIDEAALDPELAGVELRRADANGDGVVAGEREIDRLFDLLDRADGRRDRRVRAAARTDRAVVLVGMSDTAIAEARALRRSTPVLLVTDVASGADVARGGDGVVHDVSSREGRESFVRSLHLADEVAARIRDVLDAASSGARRELAELARIWAAAERGERIPQRLLVSGHGDSRSFFGDDDDGIGDTEIAALARAMPKAAAQVRFLHLAACQHGYDPRMETFRAAFPNLQSIWGYSGFSPSGPAAHAHQAVWERATRDLPEGGGDMRPSDVAGSRRAKAVSIWTRARGFDGPARHELGLIVRELGATRDVLAQFREGAREARDSSEPALALRYQLLQELVNHLDFVEQRPEFAEHWTRERDEVLRLRFFTSHVTYAIDRHYGSVLAAGYRALGLEPPALGGMTRRQALDEVKRFEAALRVHPEPPPEARRAHRVLHEGIVQLRAEIVPARWL